MTRPAPAGLVIVMIWACGLRLSQMVHAIAAEEAPPISP